MSWDVKRTREKPPPGEIKGLIKQYMRWGFWLSILKQANWSVFLIKLFNLVIHTSLGSTKRAIVGGIFVNSRRVFFFSFFKAFMHHRSSGHESNFQCGM